MAGDTRYTIFKTRWGYFAMACIGDALCRTCLPTPDRDAVRQRFEIDPEAVMEKGLLPELQQKIAAYYDGQKVVFGKEPRLALPAMSPFTVAVLNACREIPYGCTETYASLAAKIGRPRTARAVGTTMARNPIPLIIPCHRVLRTDGGLGGFSAFGGTATKQKMLLHERAV